MSPEMGCNANTEMGNPRCRERTAILNVGRKGAQEGKRLTTTNVCPVAGYAFGGVHRAIFHIAGRQAYTFWRQQWHIENDGFRELKASWLLEKAPWSCTQEVLVLARVTFSLITTNVSEIAKTAQGRRLTGQGIRRLRRKLNREVGLVPVIVFAAGA